MIFNLEELSKMVKNELRSGSKYKSNKMTLTLWVFISVLHPSFNRDPIKGLNSARNVEAEDVKGVRHFS